jgi:hypothetical protein
MIEQEFTIHELNSETWKPIVGFEGLYSVSDMGRVRRDAPGSGTHKGRMLKPGTTYKRKQYSSVALCCNSRMYRVYIHQLVMAAFQGAIPDGYEVNHKDGNKLNNRLSNLEYVTRSENSRHAISLGLRKPCATYKLTPRIVREIKAMRECGATLARIGKGLRLGKQAVQKAVRMP